MNVERVRILNMNGLQDLEVDQRRGNSVRLSKGDFKLHNIGSREKIMDWKLRDKISPTIPSSCFLRLLNSSEVT